jgi:molybdopterin molybdotransferase
MGIAFKEALALALQNIQVKNEYEVIDLANALGRVLFEDIYTSKNLPTFTNSAMDGYAFRYEDRAKRLKIVKKIYAGDNVEPILKEGECYKIMTGAKVPSDADTIIPYENVKKENEYISLEKDVKKGNAIRFKGEEVRVGQKILSKGEALDYAKIALLASQGIMKIKVYKKLSIAVISGGDELKEPWEKASEDEVYNINAIHFQMLLKRYGFESDYVGKLPDDLEKIESFLEQMQNYDVIITSGGISMGDADFTKRAFIDKGLKELFHGVRVKPGHPTMFGVMNESFVMAFPGNPLAAIVNLLLLGIPTLAKKQGLEQFSFQKVTLSMINDLKLKAGRVNIVLGKKEGSYFIPYKNNKYGSGMITPLVESNAIVIFDETKEEIKKGENIEAIICFK